MEIDINQLNQSIELYKNENIEVKLKEIYNSIPSGTCNGCANCCMEAVGAFYSEFLRIYQFLKSETLYDSVIDRIESHYTNELIKKDYCPFLNDNKQCIIYPVRPLVCRLFGHSTKEDHEANYNQVLEMNQAADQYFYDEYGVHLPDEVVNQKIEFCEEFKISNRISSEEKNNLIDQMFQIETLFLMNDLMPEDAINMSITNWFMYLKYSEEAAADKRICNLLKHMK